MSPPTQPEANTPRTVTWTHNSWEVPALIQRISDQGNPEHYAEPGRYVEPERYIDPDGDYIEPEGEWWARKEAERRRFERDERRTESDIKNAVVRGLDFTSSWSPPWPVLCRCVLQWGRSALTRLQAAYDEIDVLKRALYEQAKVSQTLFGELAAVKEELAEEQASRAAEVKACHRMIEGLQEQLAAEKARTLRLGGDLAAERRVTTGLQTALSTTLLSTTLLARAAGISDRDQRRAMRDALQTAREIAG